MVPHSRTSLGAHDLRHLNGPRPLSVHADADGQPLTVRRPAWPRPRAVARVQDRWRIDDEWWREHPIARAYFNVVLEDGLFLTIYRDEIADSWFEQRG